jgi:hypothetical protein
MRDGDWVSRTAPAELRLTLGTDHRVATPARRAVERIKRKATATATAAALELPAESVLGPPEEPPSEPGQPPLAPKCRCADAEVKAYREGADWICHTCGRQVSARVSRELTVRAGSARRRPATW